MAASIISSVGQGSTDGQGFTTSAIDTSGATCLLAFQFWSLAGTITAMSDSKSNVWSSGNIDASLSSGTNLIGCRVMRADNCSGKVGSGHTFTCPSTNGLPTCIVVAISGTAFTSEFDKSTTKTSGAPLVQTITYPSITPTNDNEIILAALALKAASTNRAIDSGFSIIQDVSFVAAQHVSGTVGYLIQGAKAALAPTWTWTTNNNNSAIEVCYIALPGGPSFRAQIFG